LKHLRKRLTYANVMSSIAVFLVIGGATAIAANLPPNSVGTPQLKKNAVKTGKVAFEAIRAGKLSKNAVPTNRLRNSAVSNEKIADAAVTEGKLGDNAVTSGKLANDSVLTDKLANDAVTTGKIANDAVTTDKIAANAVNSQKVDGSIEKTANLLSAIVDNGGNLVSGRGAETSSRPGEGDYRVTFNRDVEACVPVATPRLVATPRYATVRADAPGTAANEIRVRIWDPEGNPSNFQFDVLILC